jgi:7-cyano-7-deazaguanine synthase
MDDKVHIHRGTTEVLVLLSGGIDSTACVCFYKAMGFHVHGLFLDLAQPSAPFEYQAALRISERLGIHTKKIAFTGMPKLTGKIRGRNAALLILALMYFPFQTGIIAIGIHAGTQYEDCSIMFAESMQNVFDLYCNGCVKIGVPFLTWSKADVWRYAKGVGIPLELTYSCEAGTIEPCGRCPSCKDIEALNVC